MHISPQNVLPQPRLHQSHHQSALTRRARLAVVGVVALLALLWNVVEGVPVLLSPGYSLYQIVWMRYAAHLVVLLLFLAARGKLALLSTERPALQIGRGLLMLAMPWFFITGLGFTTVGGVMAVFWVAPLMVLVLAALLLRDVARLPVWIATAIGYAAVLLLLRPDRQTISTTALLLALGMAFSFSLYVVLTRTLRTEATATNLFYTAVAVFVPLSFFMPALWKTPSPRDLLIMAVVGIAGLGLLWALDRALRPCAHLNLGSVSAGAALHFCAAGVGAGQPVTRPRSGAGICGGGRGSRTCLVVNRARARSRRVCVRWIDARN